MFKNRVNMLIFLFQDWIQKIDYYIYSFLYLKSWDFCVVGLPYKQFLVVMGIKVCLLWILTYYLNLNTIVSDIDINM